MSRSSSNKRQPAGQGRKGFFDRRRVRDDRRILREVADRVGMDRPVDHVDVDVVELESGQRLAQVGVEIFRRHAVAIALGMTAFVDDHDFLAQAALINPRAEAPFRLSAGIDDGGVEGVDAARISGVEQRVASVFRLRVEDHRALGNLDGNAVYLRIDHFARLLSS